ncbi:MAG: hypothetical protein ACHRHE_13745 [Tepidisphaerales bacterium]
MQDEQTIADHVHAIESAEDRAEVVLSALALAKSDDPAALDALGNLLARAGILARLDDVEEPQVKTLHLGRIMNILAENPSPETAALCLRLAQEADFLADDDRQKFLLQGLAAVRPLSETTVAYFRWTTAQGYFSINAPLLVKNGSPAALSLLEEMIRDSAVPAERRIDALHSCVLTHRTTLSVLQMADRLLSADLGPEVRAGVIESVFDYQGKSWFGPHPPVPPAYRSGTIEVLRFLQSLGEKVLASGGMEAHLEQAVREAARVVQALLARRSS